MSAKGIERIAHNASDSGPMGQLHPHLCQWMWGGWLLVCTEVCIVVVVAFLVVAKVANRLLVVAVAVAVVVFQW